jgi:hypothetical protein
MRKQRNLAKHRLPIVFASPDFTGMGAGVSRARWTRIAPVISRLLYLVLRDTGRWLRECDLPMLASALPDTNLQISDHAVRVPKTRTSHSKAARSSADRLIPRSALCWMDRLFCAPSTLFSYAFFVSIEHV